MLRTFFLTAFVLSIVTIQAQIYAQRIVLHEVVGECIDSSEKVKYHLFPFWMNSHFDHAEFYRNTDSTMFIVGTMKDGSLDTVTCSQEELVHNNFLVRYYAGLIPKESVSGELVGSIVSAIMGGVFTFIQARKQQ